VKAISLRYLADAKGEVTGAEFIQPNGIIEAKKLK
jgi:phage/plasmid primase-like uncharacterized protein